MRSLLLLLLSACSLSVDRSGTSFQCDPGGACPDGFVCVDEVCLPTQPPGCSEAVTAGNEHSCALREDGTVWCWGFNASGQVGDGSTTDRSEPVQVVGLVDVTAIDAGGEFTCASDALGVQCWGENMQGQLGDGSNSDSRQPVPARGLGPVKEIAAGGAFACALSMDGSVSCWGDNGSGQLGDGTTTSRSAPAPVTGLSGITAIAAGAQHACAIDGTGTLLCWGSNTAGQLGRGTMTANERTPMPVNNLPGVTHVAAGNGFTCAISSVAGLVCFGSNANGTLGNGGTMNSSMPVSNAMPLPPVSVTAGNEHACARDRDGGLWCWGRNSERQLADTTQNQRSVPVRTTFLGVKAVAAGAFHTCALLEENGVACIGSAARGQLGDGKRTIVTTPQTIDDFTMAKTIATGTDHACAQRMDGTVHCWGNGGEGQIGDGSFSTRTRPTPVVALAGVKAVQGGGRHTCAELTDEGLVCWGLNSSGQIGDASTNTTSIPRLVFLGGGVSGLELAERSSCGLVGGQARCWGNGQTAPADASNGLVGLLGIARGNAHTCAIQSDRSVVCWGNNSQGQLGRGNTLAPMSPTEIISTGLVNATKIYAEGDASCAILMDGSAHCWGRNFSGHLGVPASPIASSPMPVTGLTNAVQLSIRPTTDTFHEGICARRGDGTAMCWGANQYGQVGDGTFMGRGTATPVVDLAGVVDIAAGGTHTCAVKMDGTVACWGLGTNGQLGDGVKASTSPTTARVTCP